MLNSRVAKETVVYFSDCRKLPAHPSRDAIDKWAKRGFKSRHAGGALVSLEYCYLGRTPITSEEAFDRFLARINGEPVPAAAVAPNGKINA